MFSLLANMEESVPVVYGDVKVRVTKCRRYICVKALEVWGKIFESNILWLKWGKDYSKHYSKFQLNPCGSLAHVTPL